MAKQAADHHENAAEHPSQIMGMSSGATKDGAYGSVTDETVKVCTFNIPYKEYFPRK